MTLRKRRSHSSALVKGAGGLVLAEVFAAAFGMAVGLLVLSHRPTISTDSGIEIVVFLARIQTADAAGLPPQLFVVGDQTFDSPEKGPPQPLFHEIPGPPQVTFFAQTLSPTEMEFTISVMFTNRTQSVDVAWSFERLPKKVEAMRQFGNTRPNRVEWIPTPNSPKLIKLQLHPLEIHIDPTFTEVSRP